LTGRQTPGQGLHCADTARHTANLGPADGAESHLGGVGGGPEIQADRSMRESGFDPSDLFGPFGADIVNYNPVCLNSLLAMMEIETAQILRELDRPSEAPRWESWARERAERINRLMWEERNGLYYDYQFARRKLRRYPFLTTFYPLWAGIASPQQARRVVENLGRFEHPGGLVTSARQTGNRWDAPFGWAPLEWIAVEGMRRYGYGAEADRVSE
jgi:alpha,alpha-trehalase